MNKHGYLVLIVGLGSVACGAPVDEGSAPVDDNDVAQVGDATAAPELVAPEDVVKYLADPDYVQVPAGKLMHRSCVHEVPDGATVTRLSDGSLKLKPGPDEAEVDVPTCDHPVVRLRPLNAHAPTAEGAHAPTAAGATDHLPTINGWAEYSHALPSSDSSLRPWFSRIRGSWGVPFVPPTANTTQYMFDDVENVATQEIIQPVLEYLPNTTTWQIAAWYVVGTVGMHSAPKAVSPAKQLTGITKASGCNTSGACSWVIQIQQADPTVVTTLNITLSNPMNDANQGVLEVYNVTACTFLSHTPHTTFYSNSLFQPSTSDVNNYIQVDSVVGWHTHTASTSPNCGWAPSYDAGTNGTQLAWTH